jgi:glycosyltransferase involved in cell wall biosynthesis
LGDPQAKKVHQYGVFRDLASQGIELMGLLNKIQKVPFVLRHAAWLAGGERPSRYRKVFYITETGDWVIKRIGLQLQKRISDPKVGIVDSPRFLHDSVLHFGAVHGFSTGGFQRTHRSNRILLNIYHGDFGINRDFDRTLELVLKNQADISHIVASTSIMIQRMVGWGIPSEKVSLIPIGIDLDVLKSVRILERDQARSEFGVPRDAVCIGSFQKDGNGWGEGLEPKLVKGPDIFVEAVVRLSKERKVFCLLTGPARGYVKRRLTDHGIPFAHRMADDFTEIAKAYRCLDLYIVASREEGGPMALMESMAMGVPVVTTRVGMAPDVIQDGINGRIVGVEDVAGIAQSAMDLLENQALRERVIQRALTDAEQFGYETISERYASLYRRFQTT